MKILVAEDDPVSLDTIDECLREEGFATVLARNGQEAVHLWEKGRPNLVCLDIMMPVMDGYEVCRRIRETDRSLPILFLSAKNEEIDVVVGLELGADDFIRKPFGRHELVARVRSALRRADSSRPGSGAAESFTLGSDRLTVYPTRLVALAKGQGADTGDEIELSPREVSILQLLQRHAGQAVRRDTILEHCWGMNYFPGSRTLDQHIARLRKKIETDPAEPEIIETVRGVGYRVGT